LLVCCEVGVSLDRMIVFSGSKCVDEVVQRLFNFIDCGVGGIVRVRDIQSWVEVILLVIFFCGSVCCRLGFVGRFALI